MALLEVQRWRMRKDRRKGTMHRDLGQDRERKGRSLDREGQRWMWAPTLGE
jgi:hypothetical protein